MTAVDFTVALFCRVDEAMPEARKHPLSKLYPSEVVALGMLQALRGEGLRAFHRWVCKELRSLFPRLPERSRLGRLLEQHAAWAKRFLAQPTFFGVCDSYGIELVHPWRERRARRLLARKGKSLHRWIIGAKVAVLLNSRGEIVSFALDGANVHDTRFHHLITPFENTMVVLADQGFHAKKNNPANLRVCRKGRWNERMLIETVFSLFTVVLRLKKLTYRRTNPLLARLAYTCAIFNLCINWSGQVRLQLAPFAL